MKAIKVIFLIVPVFLTACSSMYIPSSKNVPLFEKKNEVQVEAGASPNSVYLTGSYAFSEKYALIVNGSMSYLNFSKRYDIFQSSDKPHAAPFTEPSDEEKKPMSPWEGKNRSSFAHSYIEAGIGRYNMLSSSWLFEVFGGGGYGYAQQSPKTAVLEENFYENKYWMGFVQSNIGKRSRSYEFGWSLRLAFSGFNFTYIPADTDYPDLKLNFNNLHLEPLVFLKLGRGPLRGFVRGGLSVTCPLRLFSDIDLDLDYGIIGVELDYTIIHLSVGVSYRIGR